MSVEMKGERTLKPYVRLMQTARLHLQYAEHDEGGSFLNSLSCLLHSTLMVEGLMNHAGAALVASWPSENEERRRRLGPRWKLDELLQHANLSPDRAVRPYSSFEELLNFRNTIAHARTEVIGYTGPPLPDHQLWGDHPEADWERLCTPMKARELFDDAREICRDIWHGLGEESDPFFSAGHAFFGVEGSRDTDG